MHSLLGAANIMPKWVAHSKRRWGRWSELNIGMLQVRSVIFRCLNLLFSFVFVIVFFFFICKLEQPRIVTTGGVLQAAQTHRRCGYKWIYLYVCVCVCWNVRRHVGSKELYQSWRRLVTFSTLAKASTASSSSSWPSLLSKSVDHPLFTGVRLWLHTTHTCVYMYVSVYE